MKSIENVSEYTIEIKKSKFICTLIPCNDISLIDTYIKEYSRDDATHNCVAYIVDNHKKADDNGEPSGTAGMPMLNVLEKQGLQNIIAIVTRYFGGIKLGAGGLTRAYTNSVAKAINNTSIVEKQLFPLYQISVDYTYSKIIDHMIKTNNIECINITYDEKVRYKCYIRDEDIFSIIQNITNNNYEKEYIKDDYLEI